LLDDADPEGFDLVVVATPNRFHAEVARRAIEAGVPVVVDKPFARTSDEGSAVLALADRHGVAVTVFQNRRWDDDFLTLRSAIADGALGSITRFESRFERWRPTVETTRWRESADPEHAGGVLRTSARTWWTRRSCCSADLRRSMPRSTRVERAQSSTTTSSSRSRSRAASKRTCGRRWRARSRDRASECSALRRGSSRGDSICRSRRCAPVWSRVDRAGPKPPVAAPHASASTPSPCSPAATSPSTSRWPMR
jgi:hypothetical protein